MDKTVDAILKYQDEKNKLVKEVTGGTLIYPEVKLTRKTIKDNIDKIILEFRASEGLIDGNCIHCAIYRENACANCPYTRRGDGCERPDEPSTWLVARDYWNGWSTPEDELKLFKLGAQLRTILEQKQVDNETIDDLLLSRNYVDYIATDENGQKVYVTDDISRLAEKVNNLGTIIDSMAYSDSVNICSDCGTLYNIEQLDENIVCKECNQDETI